MRLMVIVVIHVVYYDFHKKAVAKIFKQRLSYGYIYNIQGCLKSKLLIIIAILRLLSTSFHNFWHITHCRKLAAGGYTCIGSQSHTDGAITLPCKVKFSSQLYACLYMFTTIIHNKCEKNFPLDHSNVSH